MAKVVLEELVHEPTPFPYALTEHESLGEWKKGQKVIKSDLIFHIHPHCQLTHNKGVFCVYIVDGQVIELEQDDILIINPNIPHAWAGGSDNVHINLGYYPEMLELNGYCKAYVPFISTLHNMYPYLLLKKEIGEELSLIKILEELYHTHEKGGVAADGIVHNRIVDLSIILTKKLMKVEEKETYGINQILHRSMVYIDEHKSEPITMEDVARSIGLNASYFSHCFKKNLGISFKQYLNRKRLEKAAVMLTTTDSQITDIVFDCGFGSVTAFYQNFIDFYKISPKKFRDLERGKYV